METGWDAISHKHITVKGGPWGSSDTVEGAYDGWIFWMEAERNDELQAILVDTLPWGAPPQRLRGYA